MPSRLTSFLAVLIVLFATTAAAWPCCCVGAGSPVSGPGAAHPAHTCCAHANPPGARHDSSPCAREPVDACGCTHAQPQAMASSEPAQGADLGALAAARVVPAPRAPPVTVAPAALGMGARADPHGTPSTSSPHLLPVLRL